MVPFCIIRVPRTRRSNHQDIRTRDFRQLGHRVSPVQPQGRVVCVLFLIKVLCTVYCAAATAGHTAVLLRTMHIAQHRHAAVLVCLQQYSSTRTGSAYWLYCCCVCHFSYSYLPTLYRALSSAQCIHIKLRVCYHTAVHSFVYCSTWAIYTHVV